jgi:hypothetical protein
MRSTSLESFEEFELCTSEKVSVEGGSVWKIIEKGLTYIGIYDAISDFHKGMNDGCSCP